MGPPLSVRSHRLVFVSLIVLLLVAIRPGIAVGVETEGADYGARPAPVGDGSRPTDRFVHALEPGVSIRDAVQIVNFSDQPAVFDIYAADMVPASNGGFAPAVRGTPVVAEGRWLTPDEGTVELGPGEGTTIGFEIDVPMEAAIGGHSAVLLVERHEPPGQATIEMRTRIGLRVEIEVLSQIALSANLGSITWERSGGDVVFHVPVSNVGEVTFEAAGDVVVSTAGGEEASVIALTPPGTYVAADEAAVFEAIWEDPPLFGHFEAMAFVEATVGERPPMRFESDPLDLWLVPWIGILLTIGALAVLAWTFHELRPRLADMTRRRHEEREVLRDYRRRRATESESARPRTSNRTTI